METKEIEIFRLSEIIARSMREELSDDERRVLDEWLAQDERHRTMYAAFGREEVLAEQVRLRQTIDWQGDCRMFMSRRKSWRRVSCCIALCVMRPGLFCCFPERQCGG